MGQSYYKKINGKRVYEVECKFKRPLEQILAEYEAQGLSPYKQAKILGVSSALIGFWRKKLGYKAWATGRPKGSKNKL